MDAEILYPTPRLSQGSWPTPISYSMWPWSGPTTTGCRNTLPRAGALRRPCPPAQSGGAEERRPSSTGWPGARSTRCGDGVLPERDARGHGRGRPLGPPWSITVAGQHPREPGSTMPEAHRSSLPGYGRFFDVPNRIVQMIFSGMFDRFPGSGAGVRRGRLRMGPLFQRAGGQQLPPTLSPGPPRCKVGPAITSNAMSFTYVTDGSGSTTVTSSGSTGSCGRVTIPT